jgi:hypothetical protein
MRTSFISSGSKEGIKPSTPEKIRVPLCSFIHDKKKLVVKVNQGAVSARAEIFGNVSVDHLDMRM